MIADQHGTTAYREGCRCSACRRAMADAAATRRARLYLERADSLVVPNIGTKRRVQALAAIGWSMSEVSRRCGYHRSHLGLMLKRKGPLHTGTARRVAETYDVLSMQLPPRRTKIEKIDAARAQNMAQRNGWPPPLAWPEGGIDDPDYVPVNWERRPTPVTSSVRDERIETLTDLLDRGASISDACRLLEITRNSLQQWCRRHGASDLFEALARREVRQMDEWDRGQAS